MASHGRIEMKRRDEKMAFDDRRKIYERIEEIRNRPLIVYTTSNRPNAQGQMGQDMIPHFIKQLDTISSDCREIDILIISSGGDPIVSWRINSLLRSRFDKITVLVPYGAYSAATLLALGANDIIMHKNGNLGPIDMQITTPPRVEGEMPMHFGYEDIANYFKFIEDIGLKDQAVISDALGKLTNQLSPIDLGSAKRGSQLGLSMAEKLLSTHLADSNKAKLISERLNKQYYHHGFPLDKREAKDIGLEIVEDEEIESLMWNVTEDILEYYKESEPFDPQALVQDEIIKKDPNSIRTGQVYTLDLPIEVAFIESVRKVGRFSNRLVVNYAREKDLSLQINVNLVNGHWKTEEI